MSTNLSPTIKIVIILISHVISGFPLGDDDNFIDKSPVDLSYLGNRVYSLPDPATGKKVETWNETSDQNPEELGQYAEGDIIFPQRTKNGLIAETFRWRNGVIPYEIAGSFTNKDLEIIKKAMGIYKKYTCITFRPRVSTDKDYVSIVNANTGCWSSVGRISGKQEINLQSPSCSTKVGTPLHELMHAVGFLHEQNRYERDDYVTIAWQNIQKGHENNFDKAEKGTAEGFGVPYDYRSVMHYSSTAFSSNGQPTIIPKDSTKVKKMGQRDGFSKGDITKINAMYNCPEKTLEVLKGNNTDSNNSNNGSENYNENKEKEVSSHPLIDAAAGLLSLFFN